MFDVNCPTCERRRLVLPKQITAVRNVENGIHVHFTCSCGAHGLWITGRHADRPGVHWPSAATAATGAA